MAREWQDVAAVCEPQNDEPRWSAWSRLKKYGCLFCDRCNAHENALKLHLDRYLPEFCDVYLPHGPSNHLKNSHPVAVIRAVRINAPRHPGVTIAETVWKLELFEPWQLPLDLMVQLAS